MQHAKDDLQHRWWQLESSLLERFGKKPDMEAILFLIGVQETGNFQKKFTKEQKQDLMHVAVCTLLSQSGYYEIEGHDDDCWPHFSPGTYLKTIFAGTEWMLIVNRYMTQCREVFFYACL